MIHVFVITLVIVLAFVLDVATVALVTKIARNK